MTSLPFLREGDVNTPDTLVHYMDDMRREETELFQELQLPELTVRRQTEIIERIQALHAARENTFIAMQSDVDKGRLHLEKRQSILTAEQIMDRARRQTARQRTAQESTQQTTRAMTHVVDAYAARYALYTHIVQFLVILLVAYGIPLPFLAEGIRIPILSFVIAWAAYRALSLYFLPGV